MRPLKAIYKKIYNKPAHYYNYSLGIILFKPIRKWLDKYCGSKLPFQLHSNCNI